MPELASFDVFFDLAKTREGTIGRQCFVVLNNLILSPTDCARESVNDFRLHYDNRADGVENEVGYVAIEITSDPIGFDASLVFHQVNSTFRNCI